MATNVSNEPEGSHQFASGFFLGILGGAVGMFVLGTKQGHELIEAARQSWANLQDSVTTPLDAPVPKLPTSNAKAKKSTSFDSARFPKFRRF